MLLIEETGIRAGDGRMSYCYCDEQLSAQSETDCGQ